MNSLKSIGLTFGIVALGCTVFAQSSSKLDSLAKEVSLLKKQTSAFANLKISGFIQAQYQYADTLGARNFNGGNFSNQADNRFSVRRARLKFAYDMSFGSATLQFDATEKGVIIKNAYLTIGAPFSKQLSLTGGIFDRPFGYAVEYSSSAMEVVERPIIIQTLFPGEQDLGAMVAFKADESCLLNGLAAKAGLFNGNGINSDVDKFKDLIAKVSYGGLSQNSFYLNVGVSAYYGNVYNPTTTLFEMSEVNTVKAFAAQTKEVGARLKRQYLGFDIQGSLKTSAGKTTLTSEYIAGKQPGSISSSKSPDYAVLPTASAYIRSFSGGYITLIHQYNKVAFFGRYDWYDPNTKVKGNEVGQSTGGVTPTNAADLMLTSTSIGSFYEPNKSLRITAQYDFNRFEKSDNGRFSVAGYKNNLLTLRIQYKF